MHVLMPGGLTQENKNKYLRDTLGKICVAACRLNDRCIMTNREEPPTTRVRGAYLSHGALYTTSTRYLPSVHVSFGIFSAALSVSPSLRSWPVTRQSCHKIFIAALPFGVAAMDCLLMLNTASQLFAVVVALKHTFSAREVKMTYSHGL